MDDQANELRQLVSQRATAPAEGGGAPKLLVVAGGKGGVGTTTIALHLAARLAHDGRRPVLVDADPDGGNAALRCALQERYTIADVLAGRRTVSEALESGPAGMQVLAGAWELAAIAEASAASQQRLIGQLRGLGAGTEVVVVDVGDSRNRWAHRFWQAADTVLLVTTTELASITEAYAAIKLLAAGEPAICPELVVNLAEEPGAARDVQTRLTLACRRFLGIHPEVAGCIPQDAQLAAAIPTSQPPAFAAAASRAARPLEQLAATVVRSTGLGAGGPLLAAG